jgi:lipid-A-disaccharide synthase
LLQWQPDVFIGIDAPDFNLGLERTLKSEGIRTVHYVSPSVWAWRESRAAKIGRSADRVLCLFPMEPPIYAQHDVDARFVGHPLADAMAIEPDRSAARIELGLDPQAPLVALLPGSRLGEIARLGPILIEAAAIAQRASPALTFAAPMATPACRALFARQLDDHLRQRSLTATEPESVIDAFRAGFHLIDGKARSVMIAADAVVLASGTATLEALLAKRAMVVIYRVSALTYAIVRGFRLMKTDRYSLPNALARESVVPELMQHDCTPENIARELLAWLRDPARVAALVPRFEAIHRELQRGAAARAAAALAELLGPTTAPEHGA